MVLQDQPDDIIVAGPVPVSDAGVIVSCSDEKGVVLLGAAGTNLRALKPSLDFVVRDLIVEMSLTRLPRTAGSLRAPRHSG